MSSSLDPGSRCPLSSLQLLFTFWASAACTSVLWRSSGMLRQPSGALRCTPEVLRRCSGGAPAWPGSPPTHSGGAPATLRPGPAALRFTPVFLGPVHRHRPLPTPPWHPSALRLLLLTFPLLQIGAFSFEFLVLIFACPPFRPPLLPPPSVRPPLPSGPRFRPPPFVPTLCFLFRPGLAMPLPSVFQGANTDAGLLSYFKATGNGSQSTQKQ